MQRPAYDTVRWLLVYLAAGVVTVAAILALTHHHA